MSAGEAKQEVGFMLSFVPRRRKVVAALIAGLAAASLLSGCGGKEADKGAQPPAEETARQVPQLDLSKAKDGTYQAESSMNDAYGHGKIAITIKDHKITECTYFGIDKDGTMKGADYGKSSGQVTNEQTYKKAQNAVKANAAYAKQLVEKQQLSDIDAISGATISYEQFIESAQKVVAEAEK